MKKKYIVVVDAYVDNEDKLEIPIYVNDGKGHRDMIGYSPLVPFEDERYVKMEERYENCYECPHRFFHTEWNGKSGDMCLLTCAYVPDKGILDNCQLIKEGK